MKRQTKQIQLQLIGDADAVNTAIGLLHILNFISAHAWSQAVRRRDTSTIIRVATREIMNFFKSS
ncbi:MAG: hypothetical protein VKJ24_16700 [Synechococcales bacterium]|nr:hypothetical protein [Synechococcales bacterium]